MNIVYNFDKNELKFLKFDPLNVYQLSDLKFYIPKTGNITPFLLISSKEDKDILKLTKIQEDGNYDVYMAGVETTITIRDMECQISLFVAEDNSVKVSASHNHILLAFDNYKLGNQIYLIENLSQNLMVTYKQIEELTKMNIELYQEIQKEANK